MTERGTLVAASKAVLVVLEQQLMQVATPTATNCTSHRYTTYAKHHECVCSDHKTIAIVVHVERHCAPPI